MRRELRAQLNLEMASAMEIVGIACEARPDTATLVPERREELTTEGGLDAAGQRASLRPTIERFREAGIQVSLFIEPDRRQVEAAADLGAPCVELHTGCYCVAGEEAGRELARLIEGARIAHGLGLRVNAGHGINLDNVGGVLRVPHLEVLNIGHSIVARALSVGMAAAVSEMLEAMSAYAGGEP